MRLRPAAMLIILAAAGCASAVQVDPPKPVGATAAACAALGPLLPASLDGLGRTTSTPASPYVAVWGEAEIGLRCGVPRPATMAATDQLQEINGIGWYADPAKPALFTAVTEAGYVEVTIAATHVAAEVLVDLAAPIGKALTQAG
jgi:hypothetical protein